MLKIENTEVIGWEHAIRGMRNPKNSWKNSDSFWNYKACEECNGNSSCIDDFNVGPKDYDLMMRLAKGGPVHAKYRRMITVYVDITAPLYWWKEYETYKVGTVTNSCSTMHKLADKKFTIDDFSHEHLLYETEPLWSNFDGSYYECSPYDVCKILCDVLNFYRELYLKTKEKKYWWQMIQLLPTSYNQRRTLMLNYEVLANIYEWRPNHNLDEWHTLCDWIETLPYSNIITTKSKLEEIDLDQLEKIRFYKPKGVKVCDVCGANRRGETSKEFCSACQFFKSSKYAIAEK